MLIAPASTHTQTHTSTLHTSRHTHTHPYRHKHTPTNTLHASETKISKKAQLHADTQHLKRPLALLPFPSKRAERQPCDQGLLLVRTAFRLLLLPGSEKADSRIDVSL